jgi:hypothetical protein
MADVHRRRVPFFIVGCTRSGTTLLQALIDNHPNIAIPPESNIYLRFGRIFHTYGDPSVRRNRLRLIRAILHDGCIQRWRLAASPGDIEQRLQQKNFPGIIEALFSFYARKHGARRWGDKTPAHIHYLSDIRRDFPDAKLIHLVRDGRDVAEAMRRMIWCPVTAVGLADRWRGEVMSWRKFCECAGSENTLIVRYEDLVTSPKEVIGRVMQFIDEPPVDTVSSYANSAFSQLIGARPWQSSLRGGIDSSKVGLYRRKFSAHEIEIMESIAGDALSAYGYSLEYESPAAPTTWDRLYAFVADRLVRWYRKMYHPQLFWRDLQRRVRAVYRLLLGASRQTAA